MAGVWHFYFLAKILLHARGHLRVNPLLSGLLLLLALAPLPGRFQNKTGGALRALLAWSLALVLAWSESWLPPPKVLFNFLTDPNGTPSLSYLTAFLANAVNWPLAALLAALPPPSPGPRAERAPSAAHRPRFAAIAASDPSTFTLDSAKREVDGFYAAEAKKKVGFKPAAALDFDLIVIHVCSLSWDDLRAAKLSDDAFLRKFHAVFPRFNAAASYSNPAAIRLLRAPCGQQRHDALFRPAQDGCYLMEDLRAVGYRTWAAANHDGRYAGMAEAIKTHGRGDELAPLAGVPVVKLNFDDTEIYDDWTVLSRWWSERQKSATPRAALYYNTISLHQGTHAPGRQSQWFKDRPGHYREAALALFGVLDKFFALVEGSGRRAVVLLVAEHGAALEGTAIQAPDLREIPLPELTQVPAAVKLLGPGAPSPAAKAVDQPVSYFALAELLRRLLQKPPFAAGAAAALEAGLTGLPETRALSENESSRVLESGGRVLIEQKGVWKTLPGKTKR